MKHFLTSAALVAAVWGLASLAAQAQPTTGGPTPGAQVTPTPVPLDGGASLLLAGGIGYAVRKLRQRRQR